MPFRLTSPPFHHHFRSKSVCQLICNYCSTVVCSRGMKAMLLADTKIELYSTDAPPKPVQLVEEDYVTSNCKCKIRNVACLGCGNVVGYHITQPCTACLESCNNGHFWMFNTEGVKAEERLDSTGARILLWANLDQPEEDKLNEVLELEIIAR